MVPANNTNKQICDVSNNCSLGSAAGPAIDMYVAAAVLPTVTYLDQEQTLVIAALTAKDPDS